VENELMSRAAIEEDYAKRLTKLSKTTLGRDEIGDTAASLQNVLLETAQQATYHQSLSTEIKQTVEQPTAEFQTRLTNLKKGLQSSVEKSYRNKGLQEGHVQKVSLPSQEPWTIANSKGQGEVRIRLPQVEFLHRQRCSVAG
jgi:hypothetical protein